MKQTPVSHSMFSLTCQLQNFMTFFSITHKVQLLFTTHIQRCGHPLKHGKPINGHTFKENNSPTFSNYPLTLSP